MVLGLRWEGIVEGVGLKESERILDENRRRGRVLDETIYAAWQPAELFMRQGRARVAARSLADLGVFPKKGDPCLEIGYGSRGWLPTLLDWGLDSSDLYGIELDPERAEAARRALPGGHLEVGDARNMPWASEFFRLVVVSTVLTSILDPKVREGVAMEVDRILRPGGAVLIYDFRFNNPSNPHVRRVRKSEIRGLFEGYGKRFRSITLLPPLARAVVPVSWTLATVLEQLPLLRSHLVAALVKPELSKDSRNSHA